MTAGSDSVAAAYTPDATSASVYAGASGSSTVNVTTAPLILPTVTVTPTPSSISYTQTLSVVVAVGGGNGNPTPTGSVKLTSGSYASAAITLSSGSATITVPAGSLTAGSDTLTAAYTPDSTSSTIYKIATGTSGAVTVATSVSVNQSSTGPAVTDQLLGMNLAAWFDVTSATNEPPIQTAFQSAGIKAVRWPGGSWSDAYNWETNTECGNYANSNDDFTDFVNNLVIPAGLDLAVTADYGTGKNCTGPGDPTEAASWAAEAVTLGVPVSHMTVGNEEYGSYETDNHTVKNDPTTYAAAVGGSNGYYQLIKAASPNTLVGVDVDADNTTGGWDNIVLANAKGSYDFVEYHFYPGAPGDENDTTLVHQNAQELTTNINTLKAELAKWGTPNTPIYVGEMGSVYSNPGKQSWSITQGLYAGQILGEMMNDGVVRGTWWIGFGNCNGTAGNDSASIYGWQDFGAYNIFSDGTQDPTCPGAGPMGTMSPTARAYQLFSYVALTGEMVLTATVGGDTTDVRAYSATHTGGTALVLFNLNETTSQQVTVTLSSATSSSDVQLTEYDKGLYDQTNATTPVWAAPVTTDLGAQTLPLTLTLTPWSMNVVIIK